MYKDDFFLVIFVHRKLPHMIFMPTRIISE